MPEPAEPLATVTDYQGFVACLRRRITDLEVAIGSVEKLAGLAPAHLAHLLRGSRAFGPVSLGAVLGALGLKIAILHDPEQFDRIRHRLPRRAVTGARIRDVRLPFADRERSRLHQPADLERQEREQHHQDDDRDHRLA
jgi:hypothetical protein